MRLLRQITSLNVLALCLALNSTALFNAAIDSLRHLPHKYHALTPIYTSENIDEGIWIPEYDLHTQNYKTNHVYKPIPEASAGISLLEQAVEAGSSDAAAALGDIYTFGNFLVPTNYTKALLYYHKAIATKANGHAYFMLGYMYSTGMFGEIPQNKQKAAVYYEFAAKNDDLNAILVLANNFYHGIGRAADCGVSKFYYATAARKTMTVLSQLAPGTINEFLTYNIALPDYNGGIYGRRVSESPSSTTNKVSNFLALRESIRDLNFESQDSNLIDYYFNAYENYHGGHFKDRNYTEAYVNSIMCVVQGDEKFGGAYFELATDIDKYFLSKCHGLLSKLYLNGHGVQRNLTRAYAWLRSAQKIYNEPETLLTFAQFHNLDPSYTGGFTDKGLRYLRDAASNHSARAAFILSKSGIAPKHPLQTTYTKSNYDLVKFAAKSDILEALFYFADAVESGFGASVGDKYECEHVVGFYKEFVERSEKIVLPHIKYAFEEFRYGNFKNSLLGFLIAAEQGLINSQISAAYLLQQLEPLFPFKKKIQHESRIRSAIAYLELASAQDHLDATVLLGDLYSTGFNSADISADFAQAFAYYSKAALSASSHGCYKLGYMYEYGLGSPNNTKDYYMAKRYYDLSRKYTKDRDLSQISQIKASTFPVTLALLRLRFKMLFNGSSNERELDSTGWFSTFEKLRKSKEVEKHENTAQAKSEAHLEGGNYDGDDEYETFDYIVLIFTIAFFVYMALENVRGHLRRMDRRREAPGNQNVNAEANNRFGVQFFFAI